MDSGNNERIIAMSSRTLTDTKKRYSNIERECMAVAYGLEKFEFYLLGRTTTIETDHSPIEQIFKKNIREPLEDYKTSCRDACDSRSGEIQTRKDDSCLSRFLHYQESVSTYQTNQRQHSPLCFRHTLPYRHQNNEVCIGAGLDHDQAKGHYLQSLACPQERVPN